MGWVGLGQSADGLDWIGSHKMDPWTTLEWIALPVAPTTASWKHRITNADGLGRDNGITVSK